MEAHFHLSPLIEPIGRKPYLKKWIDYKSVQGKPDNRRSCYHFEDVYRFLFQMLEQENLELAYKFRYTVEAAGPSPFIKKQDQLDRALKRAKNKAYEPLEKLLRQIQLELGLDFDQLASSTTITKPVTINLQNKEKVFEEFIPPIFPEISNPESTNHQVPLNLHNWEKESENNFDINKQDSTPADSDFLPAYPPENAKPTQIQDSQPFAASESSIGKNLLYQVPEYLNDLSEKNANNEISETPPLTEIKKQKKSDQLIENKPSTDPDQSVPSVPRVHIPVINKPTIDKDLLKPNTNISEHLQSGESLGPTSVVSSTKSGLSENSKINDLGPSDHQFNQRLIPETKRENEPIKDFSSLPLSTPESKNLQYFKTPVKHREQNQTGDTAEEITDKVLKPESPDNIRDASAILPNKEGLKSTPENKTEKKPNLILEDESQAKPDPLKPTIHPQTLNKTSIDKASLNSDFIVSEDFHLNGPALKATDVISVKSKLPDNNKAKGFESSEPATIQESPPETKHQIAAQKSITPLSLQPSETVIESRSEGLKGNRTGVKPGETEKEISEEINDITELGSFDSIPDTLTHPIHIKPLDSKSNRAIKYSLKDSKLHTSPLKSSKTAKSSMTTKIASKNVKKVQETLDYIKAEDTTDQTQYFLEKSDSLNSYRFRQPEESLESSIDGDNEIDSFTPTKHKSLSAEVNLQGPKPAKHFLEKSSKDSLLETKGNTGFSESNATPLTDDSAEEEIFPNLPTEFKSNQSLPFRVRKKDISETENNNLKKISNNNQNSQGISYNFARFKLPSASDNISNIEKENDGKSTSLDLQTDSTHSEENPKQYSAYNKVSLHNRKENILRIVKHDEKGGLKEFGKFESSGKKTPIFSAPPPQYKFKFQLKEKFYNRSPERFYHSASLVVSRDSIERRSESIAQKKHFLAGSSTWNYFQKRDYQPFYRDTNSLIIQKDCIEHRILNNPLPSKHALEMSPSELESFKEFDTTYGDPQDSDKGSGCYYTSATSINGSEVYSLIDPFGDEERAEETQQNQRNMLYQKSLDCLNKKEGILFDYTAGKISIDDSDKHEIAKWVRAQQSETTEMYRAYAEAVVNPHLHHVEDIYKFVRSKLKKGDFPSQKVIKIFNKIKENSESIELKRDDLVGMLKRQDYVDLKSSSLNQTISFSNSYSRYRAWRKTVESPTIKVRTIETKQQQPIIPFESFRKRWSYLTSPKIDVRSSSDYQSKHTLTVFDKTFNWLKSQS